MGDDKPTVFFPTCDCCGTDGRDGHFVTFEFRRSGEGARATCDFCQGLIDAGLIREEWVDGRRRFRQWHPEWKAGDLLPPPGTA